MSTSRSETFTPKFVTVLAEGYRGRAFRADLLAGLTVAVVALPLSMAIAVASGTEPARGLVTAIIGGLLVSALGGSRFQIGGPAGAFIVLVSATILNHGIDGLVLATFLAGIMLVLAGRLRLGTFIKYVPWPVTVGFTTGIGLIIIFSQLAPALGLFLTGGEPGPLVAKLPALWHALPGFGPDALAVSAATVLIILALRRLTPRLPGMLIAIGAVTLVSAPLGLDIQTIRDRFGELPQFLPAPSLPVLSIETAIRVLPDAFAFAFLGAIESLLSAVVADGLTGRRHRPDAELVAQGIANIGSSLFGGFVVTGTVARTATNVRAGAHGPVSGMIHAAALLLFMVLLGPVLGLVPLAALAGVLLAVAWTMLDLSSMGIILRTSRGEALVLLITLGLTLFAGLTEAIVAGIALSSVLYVHRMGSTASLESGMAFAEDGDEAERPEAPGNGIIVHRLRGAFFFGAVGVLDTALARIGESPAAIVMDCSEIPFLDASAGNALAQFGLRAIGQGRKVYLAGASAATRLLLERHGLGPGQLTEAADVAAAIRDWKARQP